MWNFRASKDGNLTFEIQDAEGQIVKLVTIENLQPKEELYLEMFSGEFNH